MKQILGQLWNGNLMPVRTYAERVPEIEEAAQALQRSGEALVQSLRDEQEPGYQRYAACLEEYIGLLTERAFAEGFRLGSGMMAETVLSNR